MKADKMIQHGILPLAVILFSVIFVPQQNLRGQEDKTKKGQPDVQIDVRREFDENGNISKYDSSYSFSWSYDGSVDMDSLFESLRNNYGISPFPDDDFFNRPYGFEHPFNLFPWYGQIDPETEGDSLYGYINPEDSIYHFNMPDDFFERFHHGYMLNDSLFYHFFNDPNFGNDPLNWQDFDMRSMMENHRKMLEEMHRFFEYHRPGYPLQPDSIEQNPLQQKYFTPSKSIARTQEI